MTSPDFKTRLSKSRFLGSIVGCVIFAYSQVSSAQSTTQSPNIEDNSEAKLLAIVPVPSVFYSPETGFGAGIGMVHAFRNHADGPEVPNSNFIPALSYSQSNQLLVRSFYEQFEQQGQVYWSAVGAYSRNPDKFFGIGNGNQQANGEVFTEISASGEFLITRKIGAHAFIGPVLRYEEFAIRDRQAEGRLSLETIRGQNLGTIAGFGLRALHSTRDAGFGARQGHYAEVSLIKFSPALGSSFEYTSASASIRRYWSLTSDLILAGELRADDLKGDVPFNRLARLGGQNLLRGYPSGLYRDQKLTATQVELRQLLGPDFGVVLSIASGWVGALWSDFNRKQLHHSYGAGFRLVLDRKARISLLIDYAAGKNSNAIYMGLGEFF